MTDSDVVEVVVQPGCYFQWPPGSRHRRDGYWDVNTPAGKRRAWRGDQFTMRRKDAEELIERGRRSGRIPIRIIKNVRS